MIKTALISSLEKCFPDQQVEDFAPLSALSVLKKRTLLGTIALQE